MNERSLQYRLDIERKILGLVLFAGQHQPDLVHHAMSKLEPGHFQDNKHQIIFRAVLNLYEQSQPIDFYTIGQYLSEKGEIKDAGGRMYILDTKDLRDFTDMIAGTSEMDFFLNRLLNVSKIEKAQRLSHELISQTDNLSGDQVDDFLLKTSRELSDIAVVKDDIRVSSLEDEAYSVFQNADAAKKKGGEVGIATGYSGLDKYIVGLEPGELIVIGARTRIGKTAFALNLVENICIRKEIPGLFLSLEMNKIALIQRLVSSLGDISTYKLRKGNIEKDEEWIELGNICAKAAAGKLYIIEGNTRSVSKLVPFVRGIVPKYDIKIVFVDYLQLLDGGRQFKNRVDEVTYISQSLKLLAMDAHVPVVALSQLSRASVHRGGRPKLHDLRDSGSIEQDADTVIFIHREESKDKKVENQLVNETDFEIAKYRHGYGGLVKMKFIPNRTRFVEIDEYHNDDSDYYRGD